jgi:tetratricopeptide (TPR) repeat protein
MAAYGKEFIIRYADNELTEEERRQFEADLSTDPSLAAELSVYLELRRTLQQRLPRDTTAEALRSTLSDLNRQFFTAPVRSLPRLRWMAASAAAACIIVIIGLYLLPSGNQDLIDRLGRTEMVSTTSRGANTDSVLEQAAAYFNSQQFARALPLLNRAVAADSSSQLALFYRGVSEWHVGAVDQARKDLTKVYNGESLLRYEAAFYIALTYAGGKDVTADARGKNKAAAMEWLDKIPAGTPVSSKANELRNKLK